MDVATLEERYLKTIKKFLNLAGVWPEQNKVIKYILWTLLYIIIVPSSVVMIARIVHFKTADILVEEMPYILVIILLILKHGNYVLNAMKLKFLLYGMYNDWKANRSNEEYAIMAKYAKRGSFFSSFYLANAYCCSILFIQVPWTARLLDMIKSRNASMIYVIPAYYFTQNEKKYYYYMQIQMSLFVLVVVVIYVACDTSYMTFVQHACGLLSVAGYRFKYAVGRCDTKDEKSKEKTYKKVRFSIQAHQHAITYLKEIEEAHLSYLFLCMGLVLSCLSITLLKVVTMDVTVEFYKVLGFLCVQLIHLFFLTLQGQFVINSTEEVHNLIYNALWYETDAKIQALYALVLRRMLKPPRLTAGGLIELNMRNFSEVIKMSVSYYTVLRSS